MTLGVLEGAWLRSGPGRRRIKVGGWGNHDRPPTMRALNKDDAIKHPKSARKWGQKRHSADNGIAGEISMSLPGGVGPYSGQERPLKTRA